MNVALDFDDTYTLDPTSWNKIINLLLDAGHNVYCVTKRFESIADDIKDAMDIPIIFAMKSKLEAVNSAGISIDVWIDDKPSSIIPYQKPYKNSPFRGLLK